MPLLLTADLLLFVYDSVKPVGPTGLQTLQGMAPCAPTFAGRKKVHPRSIANKARCKRGRTYLAGIATAGA